MQNLLAFLCDGLHIIITSKLLYLTTSQYRPLLLREVEQSFFFIITIDTITVIFGPDARKPVFGGLQTTNV